MKQEFSYPSRDGKTTIMATEWIPEGEVKAVLQIAHGMVEYIDRYDTFATWMCERGFYVVGNDHLGHGRSVINDSYHGFFHETMGNKCVIGDMHKLRLMTEEKYPGIPYFLLGHSMGSFLTRQYITMYGEGLSACIIMGTGSQPAAVLKMGKGLCAAMSKVKGWTYRSNLVDNMAFASYNKKFEPARTTKDWLTKDETIVDKYVADPWCTYQFTLNAYYHMFAGIERAQKKENMKKIPKALPLLVISGADDPVGNFGKAVKEVAEGYKKVGIKDVTCKLYEGDRHEILNELDKENVYQDIYNWLLQYAD